MLPLVRKEWVVVQYVRRLQQHLVAFEGLAALASEPCIVRWRSPLFWPRSSNWDVINCESVLSSMRRHSASPSQSSQFACSLSGGGGGGGGALRFLGGCGDGDGVGVGVSGVGK